MVGNVEEWTEDCWNENYEGTPPLDGSAWTTSGDCTARVTRGGSYESKPDELRSARRSHLANYARLPWHGFRVARPLADGAGRQRLVARAFVKTQSGGATPTP